MAWTRLLTLRLGHTTAAASTVVAAFMGGLALGAALAAPIARRATARRALSFYAGVELVVVIVALTLPYQIELATPVLRAAYGHSPGMWFATVRGAVVLALLLVPSIGLGASFPFAVRAAGPAGTAPGALYAANTTGAAVGATTAGFLLLPALGLWRTTLVGAGLTAVSMSAAACLAWRSSPSADNDAATAESVRRVAPASARERGSRSRSIPPASAPGLPPRLPVWLAAATGFAGFVLEIAWTRVFALIAGPSAYAFAATLASFITGLALGSTLGEWMLKRWRRADLLLRAALAGTALSAAVATTLAGTWLPLHIAADLAASTDAYMTLLARHAAWTGALVVPVALCLGATFPMLLASGPSRTAQPAHVATIYAVNTVAGVGGSLAAGFLLLPALGLHGTLLVAVVVFTTAAVAATAPMQTSMSRAAAVAVPAAIVAVLAAGGTWNRPLLASGAYKYARYLPADGDIEAMLTAGTLRYYRDGAGATIAVRELAGIRTLAIDGKVDASSGGDMTTQKVLAHLPLLLHPDPRRVLVVGLGSGVTAGAALTHPVDVVDVVELSPEVVEASAHFAHENRGALDDPRTNLIVGDGRSHLLLTGATYDVIVSEPSNPWMAGVAALFTQEFFEAARARLAPGGVVCQWAHTYDISTADLRSIAATFASVFPGGTMWTIGEGDLLLIGSSAPLEPRIARTPDHWRRAGVAADLALANVLDPFSLISTYAGGAAQLAAFAGGAAIQRDDGMALEYSGPRTLNGSSGEANARLLAALQAESRAAGAAAEFVRSASAEQWRQRGEMMLGADAFETAYADFDRAMTLDPANLAAAVGFVRAAGASGQQDAARTRLTALARAEPDASAPLIALSRLYAGLGQFEDAVRAAVAACRMAGASSEAFEQVASVYADIGDADGLASAVDAMRELFPQARATTYYEAALHFLQGDLPAAQRLAERAAAVDAAYAPVQNLRGAIYASAGDVPRARDAFRAALALDPRDPSVYANLGRLEAGAGGDAAAAARLFAEALTLDPGLEPARQGLAEIRGRR